MMKSKKILSGILAGTLFLTGFSGFGMAQAVPADEQAVQKEERFPTPPELSEKEKNEIAKEVASQYDVDENEVRAALDDKRRLDDIYFAGMLAKASGNSFRTVISMKADWWEVERKLNVSEERIQDVIDEMVVKDVASRSDLDEDTVRKLLDNHYHPRDIRMAGRLAKVTNKDVQSILDMKKINMRWRDVAQELGVDREALRPRSTADEQEDAEAAKTEENTGEAAVG